MPGYMIDILDEILWYLLFTFKTKQQQQQQI